MTDEQKNLTLAMAFNLIANGMNDAHLKLEPQSGGYWYWVGYLAASQGLDPETAAVVAKLYCDPKWLDPGKGTDV